MGGGAIEALLRENGRMSDALHSIFEQGGGNNNHMSEMLQNMLSGLGVGDDDGDEEARETTTIEVVESDTCPVVGSDDDSDDVG